VKQIHVLHLIETLGSGGAERLLYTNLKHLDATRFRHTVVTVFSRDNYWADSIRELGAAVMSLGCRGSRDLSFGIHRLRRLLDAERPDLLHTHLWSANVIGRIAGKLARVPVISSVHGPDHEPESRSDGSVAHWKRRLSLVLDRWTARFACNRLIAVSRYVQQCTHHRLGVPLGRIELLYNPIDVSELESPPGTMRAKLLSGLGLPSDSKILLHVGRISPQKGLLYAIRALPILRRQHPGAQLLSVGAMGDSSWFSNLQQQAAFAGAETHVHFLGPRRDIPDLLKACDLFLFPSLCEGLGLALIEAMAAGCACVATETGPVPEIIQHSFNGWLVPPRNPEELAKAVCTLLSNASLRAELGRAAAKSALARFEPDAAAKRLAEIYESVLDPVAGLQPSSCLLS
jgi:glycosyltransferase involved in cell wall biosynthesis